MEIKELRKKLLQARESLQLCTYDFAQLVGVSDSVIYRFLDQENYNLKPTSIKKLETWVINNPPKDASSMLTSLRVIYNEALWYEKTYGKQEIFSNIIKMCKNAGV